MANEDFVPGLSGDEVITDVLYQVEKALRKDCNLRPTDNYGQGYSGKVSISLKLLAVDTAIVEVSADLTPSPQLLAGKTTEGGIEPDGGLQSGTEVEINEELEIPLESDLTAVRERSGQDEPVQALDANQQLVVRRRSYRKVETQAGAPA